MRSHTLTYFILLLLSLPNTVFAQQTLTSVRFEGLKKNKVSYLMQIISSHINEPVSVPQIEEDVARLQNLPGISQATYRLDTLDQQLHLRFLVEEAITFFPNIQAGGIEGNAWFQLGVTDLNLLGHGIQLTTFYRNTDRRHSGQLFLRLPYLGGSKWGLSTSLLRWASVEPLYFDDAEVFYVYDNLSFAATGFYAFSQRHFLELGGGFFRETYRKDARHEGQNTPGPESASIPKILGKVVHQFNRLNYHYFHLEGWDVVQNAQLIYDLQERSYFPIYWAELRYFHRMGKRKKGNLATRFRVGISENRDSPFAPFVLDSYVNIRGSGNRIDRGTAMMIWNLEYRHAVIEREKIGAQVVAYSDLGTWREPGGQLGELFRTSSLRHFVGGGIRLIYKKAHNAMLRADYGIDIYDKRQRGFVVGLGQYF